MRIKSVKRIKQKCKVYDIEIAVDHSYIVQDCVLHNCIICGELDGKLYKTLEEAQPVVKHTGCRCVLLPYFDIKGGTRASPEGYLDDDTDFESWLRDQDEKTQLDVLGRTRYEMFRDGTPMKQFVDGGRVLTLKELEERI